MASELEKPFDCGDVERFSFAYLDGEFESPEAGQLEAHLSDCAPCAAKLREAAAFRSVLRARGTSGPKAPEPLRGRVRERLVEEQRSRARAVHRRWAVRSIPSVAAGVAVAAGLAMVYHRVAPGSADWVVDDAVAMHARSLPLEIASSDLSHLLPLFERQLGFAIHPPRFAPQRLSLVGGRLSHLGTRDAAYLEYGAGPGRRGSLFIMADPASDLRIPGAGIQRVADRQVFFTQLRGHSVAIWRSHEMVYSMVSDLDDADTLALLSAEPR